MKQILTAILLSVAFFANSQIEVKEKEDKLIVGKVKSGAYTVAEMTYKIDDSDTLYKKCRKTHKSLACGM